MRTAAKPAGNPYAALPLGVEVTRQVRTEHGLEVRESITPAGWQDVDTYTPSYTIVPWDYYGRTHQHEIWNVLLASHIETLLLTTDRKQLHPIGSGPGGRVRFGDDMCPSTYRVAVKVEDLPKAIAAIDVHKEAVRAWLDGTAVMPEACRT
jgi:hypothetical protein